MIQAGDYNRPETNLPIGSLNYRAFVGPPDKYDLVAANQFNLLTGLGLREYHSLLDVGCGSLRAGRLFIPYLLPGKYFGIEPEQWLVEEGIGRELGKEIVEVKRPVFSYDRNFTLSGFGLLFDYIIAHSIFSHASRQQISQCLSEAQKVMVPTSVFVATFFEGQEDYTGDEWVYPDVVTYTMVTMVRFAEDHRLACKRIDWPHPNQQTWLVFSKIDTA